MKISKLLLGAAIVSLGLASCSDDKLDGVKDPGQAQYDETRYLAIQIASPADSRADFEVGSSDESKLNTLDFIFYDVDGNITSSVQHLDYVAGTGKAETGKFNDSNIEDGDYDQITGSDVAGAGQYNVNRIWHSVVPVNLVQGQNLPAYVLCIINARQATVNSVVENGTMANLRDNRNDVIVVNGGMVMSNSVYFGENTLTGQLEQRMSATPIHAASQLFASIKDAEDALEEYTGENADGENAAIVDIYVERKAAKVGLNLPATDAEGNAVIDAYELPYYTSVTTGEGETAETTTPTVKLTFVPEYWFVNATAEEVFLTKRFMTESNQYAEYTDINNLFKGSSMAAAWNAPTLHRSFWGCSPTYWDAHYPFVSDDVDDLNGNKTYDYPENYYTYTQVQAGVTANRIPVTAEGGTIGQTGSPISIAATVGANDVRTFSASVGAANSPGYIYTLETTTAKKIITDLNGNPAATVASAVILGHYHVQVGDGEVQNYHNNIFYVQPNVNGGVGAFFPNTETVENYLAKSQRTLFADAAGDNFASVDLPEYVVEHPKKAVRDALTASGLNGKIAGYVVALQLSSVPSNTYFYDPTGSGYTLVTEENLAKVNAALYQNGTMNIYNKGRAFFNIPIRHLGFNGDNVGEKLYKDGKYQWAEMQIGDLGLVRNHVYTMTVDKIKGLGTGLRDDNEPIVPSKEDVNQYVAMRLNVLQWRVVNEWHVSL